MKLPRITSYNLSRNPDQVSAWLNQLCDKVDQLEARIKQLEG